MLGEVVKIWVGIWIKQMRNAGDRVGKGLVRDRLGDDR